MIAWLPFLDDADANHRSVVQHPPTRQLLVRERIGEQLLRPFLDVMRRVKSCVSLVFVKGKQIIVGRPCVRLQRRDDLLICFRNREVSRGTKPMAPSRGPRIAFERPNRLASHSSEGADLSLQLEPLGREAAMLKGVSVALGSAAASSVHPAYVTAPNGWRSAL